MRAILLALAVSGCGFSVETGGSVVGDDQPPPEQPDANAASRMCSSDDSSLRLCIDFDDSSNLALDQFAHIVTAQNLTPEPRATEQAVAVTNQSFLHVAETPDLDLADQLTVSMWIKFDIGDLPLNSTTSKWLYDNNTQYFAQLRVGGVVRCGSGNEVADSPPLPVDGAWHHVACTYEREEIRVYIDGHVAGCEERDDRPFPTGGMDGFAVGANLSSGPGGPKFADQFIGGIDNVQVFARTVPDAEVCTASGHTLCNAVCP